MSDQEAVRACSDFLRDHRMLVEPACGAALAAGYSTRCRDVLQRVAGSGPVVIVVCGGSGITSEILDSMRQEVEREAAP